MNLQTLGDNNLNDIFQFLDPKDSLYAVQKYFLKKEQTAFPFQRKERDKGIIEYFSNKHDKAFFSPYFFPSVLRNIKQMFTFETSFSSVKESDGSNLVSLTLFHDGHLQIQFDGQITNPYEEGIFKKIDSVSFVNNNVYFFNGNRPLFSHWKERYCPNANPLYIHRIDFRLNYKSLDSDIIGLITYYIEDEQSKTFLGHMNVILLGWYSPKTF